MSSDGGGFNNTYKSADGGVQNAGGGVISLTNNGTIDARFMIDGSRRHDINLCMRLRELFVKARVIYPTFSILPLGENGGGGYNHQTGRMAKQKGRNRQVLFPLEPPQKCCWENENCYCHIHDAAEEPVRYFLNIPQAKGCSHQLCIVRHG
jgi:hypothetical protein